MFLKLAYLPLKHRFAANICFENIKFPRYSYQLIVPRQKPFLSRNYQLIAVPWKFDVLKTNICREAIVTIFQVALVRGKCPDGWYSSVNFSANKRVCRK